jgi:hypothetical protein
MSRGCSPKYEIPYGVLAGDRRVVVDAMIIFVAHYLWKGFLKIVNMENLNTPEDFVKMMEAKGTVDKYLTNVRVSDVWDCLLEGDDNSEDESKLGLCSDMTIWEVVKAASEKIDCPDILTIEHSSSGQWRRTTWNELVTVAGIRSGRRER